ALGPQGGGHISPLSAYDERRDRVLILDVARYRYPSVWVPTESLWQAIRMVDSSSGRSRGLLRVSAPAAAPSQAPPPATPRSGP
ncbi:MAG: phytochelatin synthase family protein, partial [Cyanobium sp.]